MTELVGREGELRAIERWFAGTGPPVLLIEGPAGVGKTTLWAAAVAAIGRAGATVLSSVPSEAEADLSYSGLADLLADRLAGIRDRLPRPQVRALAVAMRLEDPGDRPADDTAVARGTLEALQALGAARRVLVAIDDLRWLDAPSRSAVLYVARRLPPDGAVRILASHRAGSRQETGLPSDPAAVHRLVLGPISVGGIHRIVRLQTGLALPRPRLLEIHAASAGNPLHAVELARALDRGSAPDDGSLASLFAGRVAALPPEGRRALALVAASADRSIERLGRAEPEIDSDLGPAIAADLVRIAGDRVQPAHPLVTHVAYEALDPGARRAIHRRLAESAATEEERALHLGRSVEGTDASAAAVIEAAAEEARGRGVRALTAALFESAARITPPDDVDDWSRRHLAAASAWYDAGDTHRVEALLEPLIAGLPPGRWRAEARWRLGTALDEAGRWQEALELWNAALEDTDDHATRSHVRCSLAITAMYVQTLSVALTSAAAAVADAAAADDRHTLAQALAVEAFIRAMGGEVDDGSRMARALAIEAELDEHLGEWSPSALAAECARHTGDVLAARVHYQSVLDRAATRGDANVEQWAAFGLASAEVIAGGFAHAAELSELVLDIAEQTDVMRIPARWLRGQVDAWLGRFDDARRLADEAMAMATAADETFHQFAVWVVRATTASASGDVDPAADAFATARRLATELGLAHATVLRTQLQEVEAAAAAGRLEQADEAMAAFLAAAGDRMPTWAPPLVARARGALLAARGDLGGATAELEAAIADPVSLDPDRGRAQLALAGVLRRARELRRSREAGEAALATFERIGTAPWADLTRRELARLPGRRPTLEGALTNAESAIAELVAAGRSNREVAAELVLSVKTVEVTLTRVYEKLGLRSRAELAARYRERAGEPL